MTRCKLDSKSRWFGLPRGLGHPRSPSGRNREENFGVVRASQLGSARQFGIRRFLPEISKDGRSLYFSSNRPGPFGGEDLWVSRRATRDEAWDEPLNLGPNVNTSFNERSPALSREGTICFSRRRVQEVPAASTSGCPGVPIRATTSAGSHL